MLNWINPIQVFCFYFSRLTWKPDVLLEYEEPCVWETGAWFGDSMVWRQCYLPSNENELRQMHRTKWFSLPYWRFMELSSKDLRIYIENRNERRKSVSIIYLISHIFFIHRLLNFENFLQVWKMLEFPISIHSLWSWEVSLILKEIFLDFEFLFLLWTRWYEMTGIRKEILCIGENKGPNQTYEIFMMKFVGTRCKTQIKYHKVNSSCKLVWHLCI